MEKPQSIILKSLADFFLFLVMAILPALLLRSDLGASSSWAGEFAVSELLQEVLLLLKAGLFWLLAVKKPEIRGFVVLVAGFFTVMLIREMDAFLDDIRHGFWVYPALLVAVASIAWATVFNRATIAQPMAVFFNTKAYFLMAIGLVTLLFFSRTIGSGKMLWSGMLGDAYSNDFKNALQEGIELYGYILIGYSAVLYSKLQLSRSR